VVVVEEEALGGTCLNWGCIPTKTMLTGVKFLHGLEKARDFGVTGEAHLDWSRLLTKKNKVVARLKKGIEILFRNQSVTFVPGLGRIIGPGAIEVRSGDGSTESLSAKQIILATGSVPTGLPGIEIALDLEERPESILIIGAGAIGCEFAHLLAAAGARVVMVELLDGLLPLVEDADVSRTLQQVFKKRKIELRLGRKVANLEKRADGVSVSLDDGAVIDVEKVLVSVGRRPRTDGLGLEEVGIECDRAGIVIDERLKTTADGFWAIGDVTGKMALAHVASAQGVVAAENAMGGRRTMSYDVIPACVFTEPEVATVGITEMMAERRGKEVAVGRFPWVASGRAQATGETVGFVKVLVERKTDLVLGAQVVGPEATSLVAELALAMEGRVPATRIHETIHAHPTYTEAVQEAVGSALGCAIHA